MSGKNDFIKLINQNSKQITNNVSNSIQKKIDSSMSKSLMGSFLTGQIKTKDFFDIKALFKTIEEYDLLVGVPSDKAPRNENDVNNAELVYLHTHGVDKKSVRTQIKQLQQRGYNFKKARQVAQQLYQQTHGSPAYHIPPRPIIEPALEHNAEKISEKLQRALKDFCDFNFVSGEQKLKNAGMYAQNVVRKWFTNSANGWAPLTPSTIKAKRNKENPLIDTGEMRKSIVYIVRTPNNNFVNRIKKSNEYLIKQKDTLSAKVSNTKFVQAARELLGK